MSEISKEVTNWEIFMWSLDQLDGRTEFIETEEVFLKCFSFAPNRFAWRTRSDLADYKKCSKALRDAEAKKPPLLIKTKDGFRRQLTVEGQNWVDQNRKRLISLLHTDRIVQEPKQRPRARLLAEVERSTEFEDWKTSKSLPDEKWKMAEILRCSPDSDRQIWSKRLEVIRSAAHVAGKKDVLAFLAEIAETRSDWFYEGK